MFPDDLKFFRKNAKIDRIKVPVVVSIYPPLKILFIHNWFNFSCILKMYFIKE